MSEQKRRYQVIIWHQGKDAIGEPVTIVADNMEDAVRELKQKYGQGIAFTLHDKNEADK